MKNKIEMKKGTCKKTTDGEHTFRRWNLTMDVWFDSGEIGQVGHQTAEKCVACGKFKGDIKKD
jgi:isoleucyl-tRNA synthetase